MEESKWIIVRKEKLSTKIKNYFKNFFSKIIKNKKKKQEKEYNKTISTKDKLSKGSITIQDVEANQLDPLIDLYRDGNKKIRSKMNQK